MASDNISEENVADLSHWYVVYTYSGYENKVKATLEKIVENRGIRDKIQQIIISLNVSYYRSFNL